MSLDPASLDWDKGAGLLPAIVQDSRNGRVLMQGWMNREALQQTLQTGKVTFYSRSKQRLWTKGESSAHWLLLRGAAADCDADAILLQAEPQGPTCHLGTASCFGEGAAAVPGFLGRLDALVQQRERERPADSYTTRLFEAGLRRIAQKVGEEGVETALAAVAQDEKALVSEAADLLFHLTVLLRARGLGLADAVAELERRHG
ncbi:bifunctional phosphoribosyl-AMP cyclohydrolase/phosphoribosyl-ATP diphosphatase HisIE [Tahibacter harae]|uniref:Histidine biosynthesis bifunctional protein HisIE n=1 Tax=Tahibacter harae TaxID=2963937 RepID=A0ABT1QSY2_9GAMM|nr:bifunctional phosphoribosyl-AMP cyclohydrolase/phosphoribosyl-ATP diphosphatase HisIE [Tahibacter harae]MCQ4165392.1 bifunctional phosphoribosyl-AMP cyclohydrolase/phosphoribosyl-ATP diphosphatase HisIE [Tahibacter harae]